MNASSDQISIGRYLDPIRRFAPLVLVGALVGAGLGFAAHILSGTTYTSGVSVLVSPISGDPVDGLGTSVVEVDMATAAVVATSLVVAERANDLLAGQPPAKDPRDLLGQVETTVRGTRIIEMDFTAAEPEAAQRGAAAFAEAFLSYRDELATSQLEVSSGRLEERITQLQLELTDVSTRRAEVPEAERDGAAYAALVISEQTLLDELSVNQGRLADLRAVITDDAVVLDSASLPKSPSSLGLSTLLVGGAAVGFVLAAGLALMLDAARRRGEDDELAEEMAARQVLDIAAEGTEAVTVPAPPVASMAVPVAPPAPAPAGAPAVAATDLAAAEATAWEPSGSDTAWDPTELEAASVASAAEASASWEPTAEADGGARWGDPAPAGDDPLPSWEPTSDAVTGWDAASFGDDPRPNGSVATDFMASDLDASLDEVPDAFAAVDRPDDPDANPAEPVGAIDDRWSPARDLTPVPGVLSDALAPNGIDEHHDSSAEDLWAAPLAAADEASGENSSDGSTDDPAGSSEPSTSWDPPGDAIDGDPWEMGDADPWAGVDTTPWSAPHETPSVSAVDDPSPSEPVDLDDLIQERALVSVAQLGDHLTRAVDLERRVALVVDGGDGAAQPVAVAMAAHLASGGRQSVLIDPRGDVATDVAPGRHHVRDHPTLDLVVGGIADDVVALIDGCARDATVVVVAGDALDSHLVAAHGDWPGAIVIATTGVANPASIPEAAFDLVMGSHHPLIGIVSIMARPAMAPPGA